MALTATLALDIKAFEGGLSRAAASLDGFAQKTVKNTSRDLSRLLEDFTGQKVVAEAARMAEAVERIGGASKLTETEQRRVNASVSDAIAKYQALGQEAPANLLKLQAETTKAEQKTTFLSTAAGKMIAAFSVGAIANVASKILDLTGTLTDLQGKTGISTTGLQVMNHTLGQSGVSLEQAARAAVEMSKRLVGGQDGVADAVKTLGLNMRDLIESGPEQAFYAIGEAIARVPDPMQRAALATEVFGKVGADMLPAFTDNMTALAAEASKSSAIIGENLVKAGDNAGDALHRLQGVGMGLLANVFLPMAPGIEAVANALSGVLTSSLNVARGAVDAVLTKGFQFEVWLRELALSIAETSAAVPILGKAFGPAAASVESLRQRAQEARDALSIFTSEGAGPAGAAATTAVAPTRAYGESLERVSVSARRVAESLGAMQGPAADMANLESRSLQETVKLNKALLDWANTNGAVLAPSIRMVNASLMAQTPLLAKSNMDWVGFAGSVSQNSASAGASTGGLLEKFKGLFGGEGSSMGKMLNTIGPQFAAAFLGPGSAGDKMKAFATQGLGALMGMIPGVGPWLSAFSGPIVEGLSKLAAKGKALLSSIFGGPSASEQQGRASVAEFEQQLWDTLDAQQALDAGGENWKKTVIAITAAYVKAGRTEEEALAAAERLWKSSKISAEESRRVIAEIDAIMKGMPTDKTINIDVNSNTSGGSAPGSSAGAGSVGGGTVNPAPSSSGGVTETRVSVNIDGREVAEAIVPYIPSAVRRQGAGDATWP